MSDNNEISRIETGPPDDAEKIPWSPNFEFSENHFKNERGLEEGSLGISLIPTYKVGLLGNQVKNYDVIDFQIQCFFRPADANIDRKIWPESKNDLIFRFFKGAFDIGEELAREGQIALESRFFRKTFPCKGRSKSERRKFASEDALKKIHETLNPTIAKFIPEQMRYDQKVGTPEKFKQNFSEYESRFKKLRTDIST